MLISRAFGRVQLSSTPSDSDLFPLTSDPKKLELIFDIVLSYFWMTWCRTCRFGGRFEVQLVAKMVTQIAEVVPEVSEKHTPDCAHKAASGTSLFPGLLSKRHFSILDRVWPHFQ